MSSTSVASTTESTSAFQARFCSLSLGQEASTVESVLGRSNYPEAVNEARQYLKDSLGVDPPAGIEVKGWKKGSGIYLVTVENRKITGLQAYERKIGADGASGLPCEPFRV